MSNRRILMICLALLLACLFLLAIFTNSASQPGNLASFAPEQTPVPTVVFNPRALEAELYPGEISTQTLILKNLHETETMTFTLIELSHTIGLAAASLPAPERPHSAPVLDPQLSQVSNPVPVIIYLRQLPELRLAEALPHSQRAEYVYAQLLENAKASTALFNWLNAQNTAPRRLLTAAAISATLNAAQLRYTSALPEVARIAPVAQLHIIQNLPENPHQVLPGMLSMKAAGPPASFSPLSPSPAQPSTVEWNVAKIRADQVWVDFGITGEGVTIGLVDTGVLYTHPALVAQYRGNLGGGIYDHNYNWFDFVNGLGEPYDDNAHGTAGMGVMVGDDGGNNQIGVAPEAWWIAAKACSGGGFCTDVDLHAALDWMLAPTDLEGNNPDPSKAPQIAVGLWGGAGCSEEFLPDIQAWIAAGIIPVFPPGGSGPQCGGVGSPADLLGVLSAGATDSSDMIGPFSARGSMCAPVVKPDFSAPGVNIRTSINNGGYTVYSGTSFSTASLGGTLALLRQAAPYLSQDEVVSLLDETAVCLNTPTCPGDPPCPEPNNTYGRGRIDIYTAVERVYNPDPIDLPWLSEVPTSGLLQPFEDLPISVTFNAQGLEAGVYTGALGLLTRDENHPLQTLPITLTVLTACNPVTQTDFTYLPEFIVAGEPVAFTASAQGDTPITYTWDFEDGFPGYGQFLVHIFEKPGTYTVSLTASNLCSQQTVTKELVVAACQPLFNLDIAVEPLYPYSSEPVTFTAMVQGTTPFTYTWDFDDGSAATGEIAQHTFSSYGSFNIGLLAENACSNDTAYYPLEVLPRRLHLPFLVR